MSSLTVSARIPFIKGSITRQIIQEPYQSLVNEAKEVQPDDVQDAFHLTVNILVLSSEPGTPKAKYGNVTTNTVAALLSAHIVREPCSQDRVATIEAVGNIYSLHSQRTLPALSHVELQQKQEEDTTITRAMYYVQRKWCPSRHERSHENAQVLRLLTQWEKLKLTNGLLYRVTKDLSSGHKVHQLVVPPGLIPTVLKGIHYDAGHQGQSCTLQLARQRFYWVGQE